MKLKYLILIFFLIGFKEGYCKPKKLLDLYQTMNFNDFDKKLRALVVLEAKDGYIVKPTKLVSHQLCGHFWQDVRHIETAEIDRTNQTFITKAYYSKLVYHHNKIIYYKLEEINDDKRAKPIFWYQLDKPGIDSMITKYKEVYNWDIKRADLFKFEHSYGIKCGSGNINTELRKKLKEAMENDDRKLLNKWLCTPNIEKQIYAYEGLLYMKKEGQGLGKELLKIMEDVQKKEGELSYCEGNTKKRVPIQSIIKKLDKNLEVKN